MAGRVRAEAARLDDAVVYDEADTEIACTVKPLVVLEVAEFVIDRKDFGVVYPGRPDDLIKDNVRLTIELVAAAADKAPEVH